MAQPSDARHPRTATISAWRSSRPPSRWSRRRRREPGLQIDWRPMPIGRTALDTHGSTFPEGTIEALQKMDGFILGPIGHQAYPKVPGAINPHPILRKRFNLFANVRPTRSYPGLGAIYDDIDLVIVRENNEGFQPDRNVVAGSGEFRPTEDMTISVRVITRARLVARGPRGLRDRAAAQEAADAGPQEHRLQARLRHVRRGMPPRRQGISGRHRRRGHRRHHGDAADPRSAELRRRSSPPTCSATS